MAVSFPRFSWCWWGNGKDKEVPVCGTKLNSGSEWGLGLVETEKTDNLRFPRIDPRNRIASRKVRKKWSSREEMRMRRIMDKEYDFVVVPSDGVCLSDSESDESDWSIGWSEPHGPEFQSDNDSDNSFAVLVPCYSHGSGNLVESPNNQLLDALRNLPKEFSSEGKNNMEQCLHLFQILELGFRMMSSETRCDFLSNRKFYQQHQKAAFIAN